MYTDWQKKHYNQNQSCFIEAVILSNYIEINQQKIFAVSCFKGNLKLCAAVPSNGRKPRLKFDITDAEFEFEYPEDLDAWKIKKLRDNQGW